MRALGLGLGMLLLLAAISGCGEPPFRVHVTWPEEVQIAPGSKVVYQGVAIGEVEGVALRQLRPDRAGLVAVTLAIEDPSIQLRRADRFHLAFLQGEPVVEVRPAAEPSAPLPDGATVEGVPPFLTRIEERLGDAVESIGDAAIDAVDAAIRALEESRAEQGPDPRDPPGAGPARETAPHAPGPDPATPR